MRICYFGTYDKNYPRNRILIKGLRANGVQVDERHVPLWRGTQDKIATAFGGWSGLRFMARVASAYAHLISRHGPSLRHYDAVILGYSGQVDTLVTRPLARLWGVPVILDVFVSIYLAASERGLPQAHPRTAKMIYRIEKWACQAADRLFLDTPAYVDYFRETFGLPKEKFRTIPLGADEEIFFPVPAQKEKFQVLYFGKYIPLHGIDTILEAANLLRDEPDVHFRLHGEGQLKEEALQRAEALALNNVTFTDWLQDVNQLSREFAPYDVCLGAFNDTRASVMTIQNKIYEGMAMRKVVITGDSPTVRAAFNDGEHLVLCPRSDPPALAEAILRLRDNPDLCRQIARNGHRAFNERYTTAAVGRQVKRHLEELVNEW